MINLFNLILTISTLITGAIYAFEVFKWQPARSRAATGLALGMENSKQLAAERPRLVTTYIFLFYVLFIVFFVRSFLFEPYNIPSDSMNPTYKTGDKVLVEKFAYGIHEPLFHKRLVKLSSPNRDDVVVFRLPDNPGMNYIKRVVGIPGDTVTYQNKKLVIRDKHNEEIILSGGYQVLADQNKPSKIDSYYIQENMAKGEWLVPEGHYFLIGDNRDNSQDSRFWGFVPGQNLVGHALIKV
ncbi:signal peptidase I [uncultured Pseudoalteromonas sp.]|uniref:signal peptidase I n=1 Tax=uncultured Pseudoalteromonas sp. TaxID=114053 RepID=UPI00259A0DE6|nr:signal peptidase I [uncultured Pseudoalteromonas sp.]